MKRFAILPIILTLFSLSIATPVSAQSFPVLSQWFYDNSGNITQTKPGTPVLINGNLTVTGSCTGCGGGGGGGSNFGTTSISALYPLHWNTSLAQMSTVATSSLNLTVGSFLSPNISQWTNNSGYLTSLSGAASSTLLTDANSFSGVNMFTNAASNFAGTWQTFSPSHFQVAGSYLTSVTGTYPILSSGGTTPNISFTSTSTLSNGVGISFSGVPGSLIGGSALTIINSGVTSNVAGTGIGVSGATGAVTISNTGVTSIVAGTNISISGATGAVTINSTASGGGSSPIATSSSETAGDVPFWTSTSGTPALLSGGTSNFTWNNATGLFSVTGNASTTQLTTTGNTYLATSGGVAGVGTTTPGTLFSIGNTTGINFTTATSTFNTTGGININSGCFSNAGTCLQTFIQNSTAYKSAANYATVGTLPSYTYVNGTGGVGATITEVGTGALSIDGANPSVGQRVLIKNESGACTSSGGLCINGVYTVTAAGSGIAAFVITRSTDFNSSNDVYAGVTVPVLSGTVNAGDSFVVTSTGLITIGSSDIVFSEATAAGGGVASIKQTYGTAQTGAITLGTTTVTSNGLTLGEAITNSSGAFTFVPTISGTLGVAGGGTGVASFTSSQLLYGNGTGALSSVATSTATINSPLTGSLTVLGAGNSISCASCLTANQMITLSGDVSGSGSTAITTTIGANKVTLGMHAALTANSLIGNATGASATPTAIATSSLGIALSDTKGTLGVSQGGTGTTTISDGAIRMGAPGGTADTALATSSIGGVISYSYTTGRPIVVATSSLNISSSGASGGWQFVASSTSTTDPITFTNLGSWTNILVLFEDVGSVNSVARAITVSSDNGSTFYTGSGDYIGNTGNASQTSINGGGAPNGNYSGYAEIDLFNVRGAYKPIKTQVNVTTNMTTVVHRIEQMNALQISANQLNSGSIWIYGEK